MIFFLLDIGKLQKMWNSIKFTDFDLEGKEEKDDDDEQCDLSTLIRNSTLTESGGDMVMRLVMGTRGSEHSLAWTH